MMNLIKSKKAVMFEGVMFFIILILLTTAFITLYKKQDKFPEGYRIGERQFGLINTYQEAERALFYIDQSAKYAAYKSIYDLGQKGGYEIPDCGRYPGYNLWVGLDDESGLKECYPEEGIEKSFNSIFNKNLNTYLIKYPNVKIPRNNYDILLKTGETKLEILGKAKVKSVFSISKIEDFSGKAEESLEIKIPEKLEACIFDGVYDKDKGEQIIEIARTYGREYEDLPYVWGGESEEEGGFDCSGFVYSVFRDSGVCGFNYRLTARDYEKLYGLPIYDISKLEPGDLIFIDHDKNDVVDHVAIYSDNGNIIHSSSKNNGIKEEKIPESYKERIYSARRYAIKQEATA